MLGGKVALLVAVVVVNGVVVEVVVRVGASKGWRVAAATRKVGVKVVALKTVRGGGEAKVSPKCFYVVSGCRCTFRDK